MTITVCDDDIAQSAAGVIDNPIARALTRATGSRWKVWDGRVAQEMQAPHRVIALPSQVHAAWDQSTTASQFRPFSFILEEFQEV